MSKKQRKPSWLILYVLVFAMIAVFILESKDGLPDWANEFATIVIIIFVFAAMVLWVHVNMSSLMEEELGNIKPGEFRMEEIPPLESSAHPDRDSSDTFNPARRS